MICPGCSAAAVLAPRHPLEVCQYPTSCPCQHGTMIECDPDPTSPSHNLYVDMLPEAERRAAYEALGHNPPDLAALADIVKAKVDQINALVPPELMEAYRKQYPDNPLIGASDQAPSSFPAAPMATWPPDPEDCR